MTDPRFDGGHLEPPRRVRYEESRDAMLGACGSRTMEFERCAALHSLRMFARARLPDDVPYALLNVREGGYLPLRVGLTAIGRAPENDIVLPDDPISRRHCVVVVHATGGCEIHDTASRNGTWVNGRRIERVWLVPGDLVRLCDWKFLLAARVGRNEMVFGALPGAEEQSGPSPTGDFGSAVGPSWCGA